MKKVGPQRKNAMCCIEANLPTNNLAKILSLQFSKRAAELPPGPRAWHERSRESYWAYKDHATKNKGYLISDPSGITAEDWVSQ